MLDPRQTIEMPFLSRRSSCRDAITTRAVAADPERDPNAGTRNRLSEEGNHRWHLQSGVDPMLEM